MLKDRRKPWQKTTNVKWSRCGHMLADTARAMDSTCRVYAVASMSSYAVALGISVDEAQNRVNAQIAREAVPLIVAPSELTSEERRKQGRKILARVRASIDKRMIGGLGPEARYRNTHEKAWTMYVEALGHDPREQPAPMAQAA